MGTKFTYLSDYVGVSFSSRYPAGPHIEKQYKNLLLMRTFLSVGDNRNINKDKNVYRVYAG